ncbi:MAG TPA: helix-turn-helix domain-containing protein [Verrucomicrobiae bacterium]|nr:helix-turn-helix domain-containing protein [Verrucomicrobiae bacterium]
MTFADALRELRKSRDLSQMALAEVAQTSQRHVSFLELGRSKPSRAMVFQISESLGLTLANRNRLLLAAGFAAAYPQRELDSVDMVPLKQALQRMLRHHKPYPAIVVNRRWDLVLMNGTVARMFALIGDGGEIWKKVAPDGRRNILKMIFSEHGLRPYIRNFEDVARMLLGYVQREAGQSAAAAEILEELLRDTGLPRRLRASEPLPQPTPVFATQLEALGVKLSLFTMISTFGTPQDVTAEELRVGSFYPADDDTEAFLRNLAAQPAGEPS